MGKLWFLAASMALAPLGAVNAATTVSAAPATNPYSGPAPNYDFSTLAPITGGSYRSGTAVGDASQPFGTDNPYYAVGPINGSPAVLSLASFGLIPWITLSWGSVDSVNVLEVLDAASNVLATITGTQIQGLVGTAGTYYAPGALVRLDFSGATINQVDALRFSSANNSFEFDNIAVAPVPEPGIWAMMLIGFGAMGFALRRRGRAKLRVRYV